MRLGSRVLVTGAAGFIGSHLAEKLRSMGLEVVGYDNFANGYEENLSAIMGESGFRLVRGDVLDMKHLCRACRGADSIIHMAAQPSVARSFGEPVEDFEVNALGTLNVLECARRCDARIVLFASSSTVYGEAKLPTPEEHPLRPISNYGASKAAAETYCSSYSALYGLRTASLRYFNIYGPRSRKGVMFDLMQKLSQNKERLEVLGTGRQEKDYLYVDDAVDATLRVVEKGRLRGEAYNVGSGVACTVRELTMALLRISGLSGRTKVVCRGGLSWPPPSVRFLSSISMSFRQSLITHQKMIA
jgi:UDP-glucose 4-epimerase